MKTSKILLALILLPAMLFAQQKTAITMDQKIINTEINPSIYTDSLFKQPVVSQPDWKMLKKNISKKYTGVNYEKIINTAKTRYYLLKHDWPSFADAYLSSLEKYDLVDTIKSRTRLVFSINNTLFNQIFKNISDKSLLLRAAVQAKKIIDNPNAVREGKPREIELSNNIDTYANLLYRAGKVREAIQWQKRAVDYTNGGNKDFVSNLEKMKGGLATW